MGTSGLPEEVQRLEAAYNIAAEREAKIFEDLIKAELEVGTQRTAFFEKVAIGSGATIAALVSFLGTHAAGLHPHWVLRCSLVSLVIAIVAALYRNFRYPVYLYSSTSRQYYAASANHAEHYNALFQPQELGKTTSKFEAITENERKRETRLARSCKWAEVICLIFVSVAMIALVWLALCNF